jgi:uncharacterized protein
MLNAIGAGLGVWAIGLAAAAAGQRRLIFKPPTAIRRLQPGPWPASYRIEPLSIEPTPGVTLEGWRSMPSDASAPLGTLWYLGGRGENVAWAPHMSSYLRHWSVVAFNYRGFGASTGLATETGLRHDMQWLHATVIAGVVAGRPWALMGRSLGTGLAIPLAASCSPDRLILVSPVCSLRAIVAANPLLAPATFLLKHPLDAVPHAGRVSCPTLVVLAQGDRQVPNRHSLHLAGRLGGPVVLRTVQGAVHRTLPRSIETQQSVAEFLRLSEASARPAARSPASATPR